jgi:hypothetical protein
MQETILKNGRQYRSHPVCTYTVNGQSNEIRKEILKKIGNLNSRWIWLSKIQNKNCVSVSLCHLKKTILSLTLKTVKLSFKNKSRMSCSADNLCVGLVGGAGVVSGASYSAGQRRTLTGYLAPANRNICFREVA